MTKMMGTTTAAAIAPPERPEWDELLLLDVAPAVTPVD